MRYFLDTEFDERAEDARASIQLISIGLVAEDGREFYAENADYDWADDGVDPWLVANVKPHLAGGEHRLAPAVIRDQLVAFFADDDDIEIWAYYADYDWVVFCSIFGRMIDLPQGMPKFCHDLKQLIVDRHVDKTTLPVQDGMEHHALADARWNRDVYRYVRELADTMAGWMLGRSSDDEAGEMLRAYLFEGEGLGGYHHSNIAGHATEITDMGPVAFWERFGIEDETMGRFWSFRVDSLEVTAGMFWDGDGVLGFLVEDPHTGRSRTVINTDLKKPYRWMSHDR